MTPDKFKKIAPEFDGAADDLIQCYLDLAIERLDASTWGKVYGQAVCYLAAHIFKETQSLDPDSDFATAAGDAGAAGPVSSVAVGRWSMSFGGGLTGNETGLSAGGDGDLVRTFYGRQYLALRKTRAAGRSRLIRVKGFC